MIAWQSQRRGVGRKVGNRCVPGEIGEGSCCRATVCMGGTALGGPRKLYATLSESLFQLSSVLAMTGQSRLHASISERRSLPAPGPRDGP